MQLSADFPGKLSAIFRKNAVSFLYKPRRICYNSREQVRKAHHCAAGALFA